jgi:hypothetical protein
MFLFFFEMYKRGIYHPVSVDLSKTLHTMVHSQTYDPIVRALPICHTERDVLDTVSVNHYLQTTS